MTADLDWRPGALPPDWSDFGLTDQGTDWQERGLCAQIGGEEFFPEVGVNPWQAKRMCMVCEVRQECLAYALANQERWGIWGGLSERERRKLQPGAVSPTPPPVRLTVVPPPESLRPLPTTPKPLPPRKPRSLSPVKVCTRCKVEKARSEFYPRKNCNKVSAQCKVCINEVKSQRHAARRDGAA